jgi:3-oxoacyl-[acyl-carrier protein] reductase
MMFDLKNKVAVVTGASRGIGKSIAETFASAGAIVICVSRSEDALINLVESLKASGGNAHYRTCDISDGEAFTSMVKSIVTDFGQLDILINNAGITQDTLLMRMSDEQWTQVLDINLKGAFFGIKAVMRPMMKKRWGRIINISSIVGITGNAGQANYAASKAGLIGLKKIVAKEVASRGITVNCIAPGFIKTDMTDELSDQVKEKILKDIPIGRMGDGSDIASAVLFLASEEASFITGQTIVIDGGQIIS